MTVYSNLCTDEGMSVGWNNQDAAAPAGATSMGSVVQTITRAGFAWDPSNTRTEPSSANGMYFAPAGQRALNTDGWHSFYLNDAYHSTYPLYINFAYSALNFQFNGSYDWPSDAATLFFNLSNACSVGGALTGATLPARNYPEKNTTSESISKGYPYVPYWGGVSNSHDGWSGNSRLGEQNGATPGASTLYGFDANQYVTAHSGDGFAYWMPVDDLAANQSNFQSWLNNEYDEGSGPLSIFKPQIYVHRAFDYDTGEVLPYAMMNYKHCEFRPMEGNGYNTTRRYVWRTMADIQTINLLTGKTMKWQGQTESYFGYMSWGGSFPELFRWPMPTGPQQQTQYPKILNYVQNTESTHQTNACSWDGASGLPVYGKRPVFQNWWPVDHGEHPVFWPFLCAVPYGAYYPDDEITFAPSPAMASRTYKVMRVPVQKDALWRDETKDSKILNASRNVPAKLLTIPVA